MNIGSFDLNLLVVFDALLADGSVTGAARRVGLSQPAFSHAIARLRGVVGDPLFERTSRGMRPTARALAMAGAVRSALAEAERAFSPPTDGATPPTRTVTIAASSYARCLVLPAVARRLEKTAPGVSLDIRKASAGDERADESADLTLDGLSRPGARSAVVLYDRLVCIVRRTNRRVGRRLSLRLFAELKHIVFSDSGEEWPTALERVLLGLKVRRKTGVMVPDVFAASWVVSQTDWVATVPYRVADSCAPSFGLRILALPVKVPDAVLRVAWPMHTRRDPVVSLIKDYVLDAGHHVGGGLHA